MSANPENSVHCRTFLTYTTDDDTIVLVEHVFAAEGHAGKCDECGQDAHDPGVVGLALAGDNGTTMSVLVPPEVALLIANRLERAANAVLESMEEPEDLERSMARFGAV